MLWEFLVVFIVITFKKTKTINCSAIPWRLRLSVSFSSWISRLQGADTC